MAKIGVEVAVDSAAFVKFYDIFQKYQEAYEAQPAAWEKAAEQAGTARTSFEESAKAVKALADNMSNVLRNAQGFEQTSNRTSTHWTRMARNTKDVAGNIASATVSLLKWANVIGIVTGVVGAGGLYGIDVLAHSVASGRTTSLGLGTSYGGLQATRINYGTQIGDAEGMLGRIADAQNDVSKRVGLGALGISGDQLLGRDTADVSADALEALKRFVDSTPEDILQNRLDSSHVGDVYSLQEARRVRSMSPDQIHKIADSIRADRKSFDLDTKTQQRWQELSTQLSRASSEIEALFVRRLVELTPGIEKLSKALADLTGHLLEKDGPFSQWVSRLNEALDWFSTKIESPSFKKEMIEWVDWAVSVGSELASVGKAIGRFLGFLTDIFGVTPAHAETEAGSATAPGYSIGYDPGDVSGIMGHPAHPSSAGLPGGRPGVGATKGNWWTNDRIQHAYDRLVAGGLSPLEAEGQIARMAYIEAGAGPTSENFSGGGHFGIYQADRHRQGHFGRSANFDDQLDGIIAEKKGEEGASHRAGLAAKTDLDAARAASMFERGEHFNSGTGYDDYTGATARAIPKVHAIIQSRPRTSVTINAAPGANTSTAAAAAAVPP